MLSSVSASAAASPSAPPMPGCRSRWPAVVWRPWRNASVSSCSSAPRVGPSSPLSGATCCWRPGAASYRRATCCWSRGGRQAQAVAARGARHLLHLRARPTRRRRAGRGVTCRRRASSTSPTRCRRGCGCGGRSPLGGELHGASVERSSPCTRSSPSRSPATTSPGTSPTARACPWPAAQGVVRVPSSAAASA